MKTVLKIIKWVLSVIMALFAIVGFSSGGILSGILFLLIAVALNPIVDGLLRKKNLRIKPVILVPSTIVLFLVACIIMPSTSSKTDSENISTDTQVVSLDDTTVADTAAVGERNIGASEEESKTSAQSVVDQQENDEQEQLAKEQAEKEEQERLAKEAAEKEEQERLAKEAAEKEEQERLAKEAAEKEEQERLAKEKTEQERQAQEQANTSTQTQNAGGGNANNFDTYNNSEQQNTTDTWVLNTKSMKIHYPSCKDVKKISPENYSTSSLTLDDLKNQGYTTCGHCFK